MNIIKTTLMTTALLLSSTTAVFAQDAMMDKAKEMAVDKGADMAKETAEQSMGDDKAQYIDPAAKIGKDMLKGDSAKDAVMNMGTSEVKSMGKDVISGAVTGESAKVGMTEGSISSDEAMTAGKVIMKGGSTEDAAMAIAKKRAKDQIMEKAEGLVTEKVDSSTVVMDGAIIESSTVVTTDPSGDTPPVQATVTTMTTPAVETKLSAATVLNCPAGTTGQADGSCMITGDYEGQ